MLVDPHRNSASNIHQLQLRILGVHSQVRVLLITFCATTLLQAQWQANGVPVCDTSANTGYYMLPQIAPDGDGGAYVCWKDARNGNYDIYAQRIGHDGRMLWQKNGIPIVDDSSTQQFPRIISDARGSAFIAWEDNRSQTNTHIYAQRIEKNSQSLWQIGGVKVAETPGLFISLAEDGKGGLFVAWNSIFGFDPVTGIVDGVFIQRLNSLGQRIWPDSGVQVSNRPGRVWPNDIAVISDGLGGAIIAWSEGEFNQEKIYAQRIDSFGKPLWLVNGIEISQGLYNIDVGISSDLTGGAIISWTNLSANLKYAQRITSEGKKLWGTSGIVVGGIVSGGARRHTADNQGGAFIGHSKWIQHVNSAGVKRWEGEGAQYTDTTTGFFNSTQALGLNGGIWNFWSQNTSSGIVDIYGQYVDGSGNPQWGPSGKPICNTPAIQDWSRAVPDGRGRAIVVWDDFRNGHSNIFAVRVDTLGTVTSINDKADVLPDSPRLEQNYPNPFNPETIIEYKIPSRGTVQLIVYDTLGKEVITLVNERQEAGFYRTIWNGKNSRREKVSSGPYYYRLFFNNNVQATKKIILLR
ncbi:MAG TPA: T9SS type A sorting domain-containing protein [Bacteroidota bacterium]|nr:T9SS type A sorting domain-containing protein [Bacteroidota bacterium]